MCRCSAGWVLQKPLSCVYGYSMGHRRADSNDATCDAPEKQHAPKRIHVIEAPLTREQPDRCSLCISGSRPLLNFLVRYASDIAIVPLSALTFMLHCLARQLDSSISPSLARSI
eukprot:6188761-Amphidinium_carterae.2